MSEGNKDECQKFRSSKSEKKGPKRKATAPTSNSEQGGSKRKATAPTSNSEQGGSKRKATAPTSNSEQGGSKRKATAPTSNNDKEAELTKKRKEKASSKKMVEATRQDVAIQEAHDLFFKSIQLSTTKHDKTQANTDAPGTSTLPAKTNTDKLTTIHTPTDGTQASLQMQNTSALPAKTNTETLSDMHAPNIETQASLQMQNTSALPAKTNTETLSDMHAPNIETLSEMHAPNIETQASFQMQNTSTLPAKTNTVTLSDLHAPNIETQASLQMQNTSTLPAKTNTETLSDMHAPNIETQASLQMQNTSTLPAKTNTVTLSEMPTPNIETQPSFPMQNRSALPPKTNTETLSEMHTPNIETLSEMHAPNIETLSEMHAPNIETLQNTSTLPAKTNTVTLSEMPTPNMETQPSFQTHYIPTMQTPPSKHLSSQIQNTQILQTPTHNEMNTNSQPFYSVNVPNDTQAKFQTYSHTVQIPRYCDTQANRMTKQTHTVQTVKEMQGSTLTPYSPATHISDRQPVLTNIQTPFTPTIQTPNKLQPLLPYTSQLSNQSPCTPSPQTPLRALYANKQSPCTLRTPQNQQAFMPTQQNLYQPPSERSWTASLYSPISEEESHLVGNKSGCRQCAHKDRQLETKEQQIRFLRDDCARLKRELARQHSSDPLSCLRQQEEGHYYPSRGQRIDKCEYIVKEDENTRIPDDYVAYVPGQPVYVKKEWLVHVQATFKMRSKKLAIKNMMSGLYEPEDVQGHTATSLIATPVGKALREFSIMVLGVDATTVVNAINSKIGTMTRALKFNRVRRLSL